MFFTGVCVSKLMITTRVTIAVLFLLLVVSVGAQSADETYTPSGAVSVSSSADSAASDTGGKESQNTNIDFELAYGEYNTMFSTISLSQEQDTFAYLLTADSKRSNDFGYNKDLFPNTSYSENKIGLTGDLYISDRNKTTIEATVDNDSRGMASNQVYSREEKEKFSLSAKSVIRQSSSLKWSVQITDAGYVHRLAAREEADNEKSSLNKLKAEATGEIVWSATNSLRAGIQSVYYNYSEKSDRNDAMVRGEIIDDFRILSSVGVSIGLISAWNRDGGILFLKGGSKAETLEIPLNPLVGVSYLGSSYFDVSIQYRHDGENFKPENIFFDQRYVCPEFDLPPSVSHIGELKFHAGSSKHFEIKSTSTLKKTDVYYNYVSDSSEVLGVYALPATVFTNKMEGTANITDTGFFLSVGYDFFYANARDHITYKPNHAVSGSIKFESDSWNVEWMNTYNSPMYIDPIAANRLTGSIVGLFGVQLKMVKGLFSYLRIENLYNNKYYLRDGYPEAGITVLGGLRILL